jgi:putative peptidoglycan lipid II flippase
MIFSVSTVVTIISLAGSALGLVTQLLLARQFGLSIEIDVYIFSLALPTFVVATLASIINYVAVPRLASLAENKGKKQGYAISLLNSSALVGFVSVVIGGVFLISLQTSYLPEDSELKNYHNLELLMIIGWALGGVQLINYTAISILNAYKYHTKASLATLLPNIGPVIVLSLNSNETTGFLVIIALLAATIASTLLVLLFIWNKILHRQKYNSNFEELINLIFASPKAAIAMTCFTSWVAIDSYWAPQISIGALSTLAYAQRLIIAAGNIAVIGPITTLTPDLARLAESGQIQKFLYLYFKTLLYIAITAITLGLLIYFFGIYIIEFIFTRGVMKSNEAKKIASTLNFMLPGMIAMLMSAFAFRAIFCFPRFYTYGAIIGAAWSIQYYVLCGFYIDEGIMGIAIAYDICWATSLLLLNMIIFFSLRNTAKHKNLN